MASSDTIQATIFDMAEDGWQENARIRFITPQGKTSMKADEPWEDSPALIQAIQNVNPLKLVGYSDPLTGYDAVTSAMKSIARLWDNDDLLEAVEALEELGITVVIYDMAIKLNNM